MYSTDKLPELNEKYEKIRTNGIEILSDLVKEIKELKGISEINLNDEVLRFKLFNHKILIALGIEKGKIPIAKGILEVYLETKEKRIFLMKDALFINKDNEQYIKNGEKISENFPKFLLDNIIPTLISKCKISFID